jgi:hypothetical protein
MGGLLELTGEGDLDPSARRRSPEGFGGVSAGRGVRSWARRMAGFLLLALAVDAATFCASAQAQQGPAPAGQPAAEPAGSPASAEGGSPGVAGPDDSAGEDREPGDSRSAAADGQRKCGRGRYLSNGHCCPRGTVWNGRRCLRNPGLQPLCPAGAVGVYPDCRAADSGPRCPSGTTGSFPNCIPAGRCPAGMVGAYPNCRPIQPARCPTGFTGTPPSCQPIIRRCPPGTYGTPPLCRRTPLTQPSPRPVQPRIPSTVTPPRAPAGSAAPLRPGSLGGRPR